MDPAKYEYLQALAAWGLYTFPSTIEQERAKAAAVQELDAKHSQAVAEERSWEGERTRER